MGVGVRRQNWRNYQFELMMMMHLVGEMVVMKCLVGVAEGLETGGEEEQESGKDGGWER